MSVRRLLAPESDCSVECRPRLCSHAFYRGDEVTGVVSNSGANCVASSWKAHILWGTLAAALGLRLAAMGERYSAVLMDSSPRGAASVSAVHGETKFGEEFQIGGVAYTMEVAGCNAYIGLGPRVARMAVCGTESLEFTDISPRLGGVVTSIAVGSGINYVGTSGGKLYALSGSEDVLAVGTDISLPFAPTRMFFAGPVLLVAGSTDALAVLDLSQPDQPVLLFDYRLAGDLGSPIVIDVTGDDKAIYVLVRDNEVNEHFVYALERPTGRVKSPEDLKVLSQVLVAGATNTTRLKLNHDRLYAMQRIGQIIVINTADRSNLEVLNTWDPRGGSILGSLSDIAVAQNKIVLTWIGNASGQNKGQVQVFDQNTIGSTVALAVFEREDWRPSSIAITGDRMVVVDAGARADVLELTDQGVIRQRSSVGIQLAAANSVAPYSDGSLAVASSKFGLWRVMSTTMSSGLTTSIRFPGITHFIAALGDGSLFGLSRSSLFISAPSGTDSEFVEVTATDLGLPTGTRLFHAYTSGNTISVVSHTQARGEASGHVTIVDISERTQPSVLGAVTYGLESVGEPTAIVGFGDRLLVAHTLNDTTLIDASDKSAPKIIESPSSLGMPTDLSVDGNLLATATGRELQLYAPDTTGVLTKLSSVTLAGAITAVYLRAGHLYAAIRPPSVSVSDWPPRVVVIDATNALNLRIHQSFDLPALATDITASESFLYIATSDAGVTAITLAHSEDSIYLPVTKLMH